MASTYKYNLTNGDVRWKVLFRTKGGIQSSKSGFKNKREADLWILQMEASKLNNTFVTPAAQRTQMRQLIEEYLALTPGLSRATVAQRQSHSRNWVMPKWANWQVGRIDRRDVEHWVREMVKAGASASTIEKAHAILVSVLHRAVDQYLISRNPATGVRLPRSKAVTHPYLTFDEVRELADAMDPRYRTFLVLLALTGLRFGEAAALTVGSIDLDARRANVTRSVTEVGGVTEFGPTKSHESRRVAFPPILVEPLARLMKGKRRDDLLFTGPAGGVMRQVGWRRRFWYPAIEQVNIVRAAARLNGSDVVDDFPKVTPHDLRHTAASLAVLAGASVKVVQKMLGHADAKMTLNTYADLFDSDLDEVADVLGGKVADSTLANVFADEDGD